MSNQCVGVAFWLCGKSTVWRGLVSAPAGEAKSERQNAPERHDDRLTGTCRVLSQGQAPPPSLNLYQAWIIQADVSNRFCAVLNVGTPAVEGCV